MDEVRAQMGRLAANFEKQLSEYQVLLQQAREKQALLREGRLNEAITLIQGGEQVIEGLQDLGEAAEAIKAQVGSLIGLARLERLSQFDGMGLEDEVEQVQGILDKLQDVLVEIETVEKENQELLKRAQISVQEETKKVQRGGAAQKAYGIKEKDPRFMDKKK